MTCPLALYGAFLGNIDAVAVPYIYFREVGVYIICKTTTMVCSVGVVGLGVHKLILTNVPIIFSTFGGVTGKDYRQR